MGIYEKPSEHFLAALDREFALHRAARARPRHRRGDPRDARRRRTGLHGDGRQLRLGHPRHERRRGRLAQRRAHRAGLHEAESLPRRDRQARDHPADARAHGSRPARRSRAAGHRRGLHECRARLARTARAAHGGHAQRSGDHRADLRAAVRHGCRQQVRTADRGRDRGGRRLRSARARGDPVRRSGRGAHPSGTSCPRRDAALDPSRGLGGSRRRLRPHPSAHRGGHPRLRRLRGTHREGQDAVPAERSPRRAELRDRDGQGGVHGEPARVPVHPVTGDCCCRPSARTTSTTPRSTARTTATAASTADAASS